MTYYTASIFAHRNIPSAWLYGWTGNVQKIGDAMRRDWSEDFAAWSDEGWLENEHVDAAFDRWVELQGGRYTNNPKPGSRFGGITA